MKPGYHIVVSAGLSAGVQATMHSWPATIGCFFSGVLIDLDHCLEYCFLRKKIPYNYQDLVDFCWDTKVNKLYLIFHAYEFLFIFWFLIYFFYLGYLWWGIAIGLTVHLACDQFTNPIKPWFYFLTFRIKNSFEKTKTLSDMYFKHKENVC